MKNRLFYGDCLDVLKNSIDDESIDLIYIDPPFNSKRNYNVLFESINVSHGAVSYLTMMALRISYMHKKMKPTGSFYLHCDPTMSHYLKIVCDLVFSEKNFRNEIIWHYRRWTAASTRFQRMHDVIFFYAKSNKCKINLTQVMPTEGQLKKHERGWDRNTVPIKGKRQPQLIVYDQQKVDVAVKSGRLNLSDYARIVTPSSAMTTAPDVWKINYINSQAKERLGYPTQKPEALLERIIKASSNEGDVIADFFCGCGTAVAVAQRLNRSWIGVDISHLAVKLIHDRILKPYLENGGRYQEVQDSIEIDGFPRDVATAKELAVSTKKGQIKFQDWIVEIMLGGVSNPKKVGDGGYDGYLTMYRDSKNKDVVLVEVKSGSVGVKNIREFIHVVEHEKSEMGLFVCFSDEVTKPMQREASSAGYYEQELYGTKYPRIQIITVEELLEGKNFSHPHPAIFNVTFKQAFRR